MKKIGFAFICIILMLSVFILPSYAISIEESNTVVLTSNAPIIETYSSEGFVEGAEGYLSFPVIVLIDGTLYQTVESVLVVCEYIDIPMTSTQVEAYKVLGELSSEAISGTDIYMDYIYDQAERDRRSCI